MPRPSRTALFALPLLAFAAGCGSGEATQGEVRDDVEEQLLSPERVGPEVSPEEAADIADCVSSGLFEEGEFTKEERDEATHATDGDVDPELQEKVENLYAECGLPEA